MAVLYRKYRPQAFSEVLGQKYIVRTLQNQVAGGKLNHAYLFTGSRGVGKTTLARILAKAVNCQKPKNGEPCNKCENCKSVTAGTFLDLVEIDAASNTGVDNIRDLIEHVKFSPSLGKYKVFIIDEVHMLSKGAFNALLKTLEEPPKHAIFVLATTEINKVPATIISRTQRFDFKRLDIKDLTEQIEGVLKAEKIKLPEEVVTLVAENAEGGARDALSLLEKVLTLGEDATLEECQQLLGITDFTTCHELLDLILHGSLDKIPEFFNGKLEQGLDLAIFNRDFLEYLRKVLVYQVSGGILEGVDKDHEQMVKAQAALASAQELMFVTRLFLRSYKELSSSPRAEIPLLLAALEGASKKSPAASVKPQNPPAAIKQPNVSVSEKPAKAEPKAAVEESETENAPVGESPVIDISLVEVRQWWPAVIEKVKQHNSPLANLIRTASLEDVVNNAIILGVKFPFNKQNIDNQKNQSFIRSAVEEISGKKLAVRALVIKPGDGVDEEAKVNLGDVLQVFGGELVE